MCGIVGFLNLNGKLALEDHIRKMTDMVSHRGPDDEGIFIDGNLALGHRRLSIIDLSKAGHQPMSNETERLWITYNGEIYNFLELRKALEKLGHIFKSKTDTEVVIHSFEEWGKDCFEKFNGIFSFAVWDKKSQTLTLVRDRCGAKPLYYWKNKNVFLFSSEIKSFLAHPEFRAELDLEVLLEYFTFQNTFSNKTLFKGVRILPQGSFLQINLREKLDYREEKYWDFSFQKEKYVKNEKEYLEELDRLFKQAVKRQLISDVEVGSYLSGGIDSGSVSAVASQNLLGLKTFCIGFDLSSASDSELTFDERDKAKMIASIYKTDHHEMVLNSDSLEKCFPSLVWNLEDLRVGQSYPNFYASKFASNFVKVCLSGIGGDEFFGGYPWRYHPIANSSSYEDYISKYYNYWQRLVPESKSKEMFSPIKNEIKDVSTRNIFEKVFSENGSLAKNREDYINNSLYFEAKTFLHGLLVLEDKLSMANGLEVRVPFLDNDLIDFAMRLPVKFKIREKESFSLSGRTNDGKIALRKVLGKYVPEEIINQKKQGFSGPDASWFRKNNTKYIKDNLLSKKANLYNYFDYKSINNLIYNHIQGKENNRLMIWSLLCFECWHKIFINKKDYGQK